MRDEGPGTDAAVASLTHWSECPGCGSLLTGPVIAARTLRTTSRLPHWCPVLAEAVLAAGRGIPPRRVAARQYSFSEDRPLVGPLTKKPFVRYLTDLELAGTVPLSLPLQMMDGD
jgi:hypothetical protein